MRRRESGDSDSPSQRALTPKLVISRPPTEKFAIRYDQADSKRLDYPAGIAGAESQSPQPHLEDGTTYSALRPT